MSSNHATDVRIINEFLIDLVGVLVPGVIFLFSVIVSIVIPMLMIYFQQDISVSGCEQEYATKTELLMSNVFHGWFWLVIFFTSMILAYAIGNIFYRLDIKEVDTKGFEKEKEKHYKEKIKPYEKDIKDLQDNEKFIDNYFNLLLHHLSDKDKNIIKGQDEKQRYKNWEDLKKQLLQKENEEKIKTINHIAWLLYNKKSIIDRKGNFDEKALKASDEQKAEEQKEQKEVLSKFLTKEPISKCKWINTIFCWLGITKFVQREYNDNDNHVALGWYWLFHLRSEIACDSKDNCQFPYEYYNVYLDKRGEGHLNKHTNWCFHQDTRTKNAINQYKIEIQICAKQHYNIIIKNEAHIRMSSSSYRVTKLRYWILGGSILLLGPYFWANEDLLTVPNMILCVLPVMVFFLNLFIRRSAIQFIHYQRLREIFFVLQVYDEAISKPENNKNFARREYVSPSQGLIIPNSYI